MVISDIDDDPRHRIDRRYRNGDANRDARRQPANGRPRNVVALPRTRTGWPTAPENTGPSRASSTCRPEAGRSTHCYSNSFSFVPSRTARCISPIRVPPNARYGAAGRTQAVDHPAPVRGLPRYAVRTDRRQRPARSADVRRGRSRISGPGQTILIRQVGSDGDDRNRKVRERAEKAREEGIPLHLTADASHAAELAHSLGLCDDETLVEVHTELGRAGCTDSWVTSAQ